MNVKRGEIYYVKDTNSVGHEQKDGRPAIIVSNEACNLFSPVVEIVYLTTSFKADKTLPTHVPINSAPEPSIAKCEHIHSVDKSRLSTHLGRCTRHEMRRINMALMISLGIGW